MGYRSVVGIMFKRDSKDAPSIPEVLALAKTKGILTGEGLGQDKTDAPYWNASDYGWDDDRFLFYVEDVKWYESYPDVQAMEALYQFVEELNQVDWYSGMFLRIGEQDDDVEQKTFGSDAWSRMWLVRAIEFEDEDLLGNQKTESKSDVETTT